MRRDDPGTHATASGVVAEPARRWGAVELARALGLHAPTAEQVAVIEAPLRPLLVVAGAGSGKTETMAARVVWLVANDLVRPDEVLGLTFTRKAAGELSERLSARLATLREAGIWAPKDEDGAAVLDDVPTVSTYHAYAGRIVREHGVRLGVEAESRLLSEAAAWQVAHEAVVAFDGPMDGVEKAESTVTTAVVDLAGEMAEHLVGVQQVAEHLDAVVAALEVVPKGVTSKRSVPKEVRDAITVLRERRAILPLVESYHAIKRSRDAMDFADQVQLAARIAMTVPQVGQAERSRFRAVLLDEFQDTSEAQLQLLGALFVAAGDAVPVTAVGDPHQSIYGWRGASSTTLHRFREDFVDGHGPTPVRPLSTSWRNDRAVLDVANLVAAPLTRATKVPVEPLAARPGAGRGHVATARLDTIEDEAGHVADWVGARLRRPGRSTAAVLCRKRSQFDPVIEALEKRGVPYEVVGLGGLLHTPEVADLVALLWVVQDPSRGDRLMRLLTGPSCRLGAADLDGLGAWARERQRTGRDRRRSDLARDASEQASIIEALDDLPSAAWVGVEGQSVSPVAIRRLDGLAGAVRRLRSLTGLGLAELAAEAEVALGLDIEVLSRPGWSPGAARAHLDAFADVAATFAASADRATLGGFLAWLDAAVDEERGLDLGWIEARPDAVQVMTVHAAKGLEWDVVAVPGLVEGSFPAHSGNRSKLDERCVGPLRAQRQGLARRPRHAALRPAWGCRRAAPFRLVRAPRVGRRGGRARAVPARGGRPRHPRGAAPGVRGPDARPHRPVAHQPRLGHRVHPAHHLPFPRGGAGQRAGRGARPVGRPAPGRRPEAAEPAHGRRGERGVADAGPRRASSGPARPGPGDLGCRLGAVAGGRGCRCGRADGALGQRDPRVARRAGPTSPWCRRGRRASRPPLDISARRARRGR